MKKFVISDKYSTLKINVVIDSEIFIITFTLLTIIEIIFELEISYGVAF